MTQSFSRDALYADAAEILAHPNFQKARRRHTDTGLAVVDGEPLVAKLICQTSRYATMALILSFEDLRDGTSTSGATPGKLLAAIGRTPFASIGWAKLMVRVFHRAGLVEYAPPGPDRRVRPFYPSEKLMGMGYEAITIFLEALNEVRPLPAPAAELARRPGMFTGFARTLVDTFFVHRFSMLEPFPITDELFKRDFGYLIFAHLMQTMERGDDGVVRASAPTADMQKRYGVSRASVRNFLTFAEEKGLVTLEAKAGHVVRCAPEFVALTDQWAATDLAWLSYLLRTTLSRLDEKAAAIAA